MVIVKLPLIVFPLRVVLQLVKVKVAPRTFVDPFSRSVPLFTEPEAGMMTCPNSTFPSTLEPDCASVSLNAPVVGVWLHAFPTALPVSEHDVLCHVPVQVP